MSCAVKTCKNIKRFKPEGISFHHFPRNVERLKHWLHILNISPTEPIDIQQWRNKFVCSVHFRSCDYIQTTYNKKVLKEDAFPSQYILGKPYAVKSTNKEIADNACISSSFITHASQSSQTMDTQSPKAGTVQRNRELIQSIDSFRTIKTKTDQVRQQQMAYQKQLNAARQCINVLKTQEKQIKKMVLLGRLSTDFSSDVKDEIEIDEHELNEQLYEIDICDVKEEVEIVEHKLKAEPHEFKEIDDVISLPDGFVTGGQMCYCSNSCGPLVHY
ncbi:uncharacterized protein LOC130895474 isoform X2 [Diorhabda carinulata]|uniref:uncharacterized protein LOC130895474 isoform X2 n=1 Tax=Diorhabda carinulata TaxID=1163345 RepID=UPI0025A0D722|nr:uncharacterized protein LOC130895474 isoform X2 [Diorhabda carinulata]